MPLPVLNSHPQGGLEVSLRAADRRLRPPVVLAYWHLGSLDAPTVAVVWSAGFAWAAHVDLPPGILIAVGCAVWAVYLGDRLLDARAALRRGQFELLKERHGFHWRHRRILGFLALSAAAVSCAMIAAFMPMTWVKRDSVLAAATLAYFTGVHAPRAPSKTSGFYARGAPFTAQLMVAVLFTAGCLLPTLSESQGQSVPALLGAAMAYSMLAWLNCCAIERWESEGTGAASFVSLGGGLLAIACGMTAALELSHQPRVSALLLAAAGSSLLLAALDGLRNRLTPLALRAFADVVLLTPIVTLWR